MVRRKWQVWNESDVVLFVGGHEKSLRFYKNNGGSRAGLHFGYEILTLNDKGAWV